MPCREGTTDESEAPLPYALRAKRMALHFNPPSRLCVAGPDRLVNAEHRA
jgi:hypothetical protein